MKTNKFIIFSSILLVIAYFLVWQIKPFEYGNSADFIPDDSLLYLEQKNVEVFLHDLENSKLGRAVRSIDFISVGKEAGLKSEELASLEEIDTLIKDNWDNKIVRELFGKKVAIALLQPVRARRYPSLADFLKENTVLVAQPKHKAEFLQIIGERYAALSEDISISTHQYGAHHIKRISLDDGSLSIVVIDGLYLISFAEQQLRRCIDAFDGELPSLRENERYSTLRDNYFDPDQFVFLSLENSREFLAAGLASDNFSGKEIVEKELAATTGFAGFSYGASKNLTLIEDKIILLHDNTIGNDFIEDHLNISPTTCDTLRFSPQSPLVFYWTNTMDFESLYQYYNENAPESFNKLSELSQTLEDSTGQSLSQLFALLGKEFSYIITKSAEKNFLSIPYGIMLFKIANRENIQAVLEKLIVEYDFPIKQQVHGSIQFFSWENSPQDGLELLYGFLDNYLFIGNSKSLAKHIIDSSINGSNVLTDPRFLKIDSGLTEANNYISYTDNAELIKIFKSLLTLSSTVIAVEDKEAARKINILTKDIVHPLLDGLSMFDRTATRSYFTGNSVVIDSVTEVVF